MHRVKRSVWRCLVAVCIIAIGGIDAATGSTLFWSVTNGTWDTSTLNWTNASGPAAFTDGGADTVVFNNSSGGTVTVSANMNPASVSNNATAGTYIFANGPITGAGKLYKAGAGTMTLTSSNAYSGGTTLNGGVVIVEDSNALGSGSLTNAGTYTLQFDTNPMTFRNNVTWTSSAIVTLQPFIQTRLAGTWALGGTGTLQFYSKVADVGQLIFSSLAVMPDSVTGAGTLKVVGAAVGVTNLVTQLPTGNLLLDNGSVAGGFTLVNLSWSNLLAARANGYGTGAGQFQGFGFAARGKPLVIDTAPANIPADTFLNRTLYVGHPAFDTDGSVYANAPVTLAITSTMLSGQKFFYFASAGPGLTGTNGAGFAHTIAGTWTDVSTNKAGVAIQDFVGGIANPSNYINEVVLAGTNSWTGSQYVINRIINCGPGGLVIDNNDGRMLVVFASQSSLPTGNGGAPAYLVATGRSPGWETGAGVAGFLLRGAAAGSTYQLPAGYKFVLGGQTLPVLGTTCYPTESATLQGSDVCLSKSDTTTAGTMLLLTRDGSLTLGAGANPVRFQSVKCSDTANGGVNAPASPMINATAIRTLIKRGTGSLILSNVSYTAIDDTTDTSTQFVWQVGRNTAANSGVAAYYDGAVRGLADGDAAASLSNSLKGFNLSLVGGVYEIDGRGAPSSFTRLLGTAMTNVQWGAGGGGLAAYNGPLTVNIGGASTTLTWTASKFVAGGDALIFGSQTANDAVTFANPIALSNAVREVRVIDNPALATDMAILAGVLSGTNASGLTKAGNGTLVLAASNTYAGATSVSNGTLLVNGALSRTNAAQVTVCGGAVLGGTGVIYRVVTIASNATIMGGAAGTVGTLTIATNLVLQEGAVVNCAINGSVADKVAVTAGTLTIPTNATVNVTVSGNPSGSVTLFSSASLAGATQSTVLSGWTVSAPLNKRSVTIHGNNVVLGGSTATVILLL